jgi:hypothetical protein
LKCTEKLLNDYAGWLQESARLLREGRLSELNLEGVAEELEAMGRSQKRELISRFAVLIAHLLKGRYQPEKRSKSWERTIRIQRLDIDELLEESPSLHHQIADRIDRAYEKARVFAESETGIDFHRFPEHCPFLMGYLLDADFFPESKK